MKEKTSVVYVAYDGTEFVDKRECRLYEQDLFLERNDVERRCRAELPPGYEKQADPHHCWWIRPLTDEASSLASEIFQWDKRPDWPFPVGGWACIEFDQDLNVIQIILEDVIFNQYIDFFDQLNIDITFTHRKGN